VAGVLVFTAAALDRNLTSYSDAERDLIERALQMAKWNKAKAARILVISRKKLYARIIKAGFE
jgi:DNA-binding NtrC family response regulator